jgi:hypothetical protein
MVVDDDRLNDPLPPLSFIKVPEVKVRFSKCELSTEIAPVVERRNPQYSELTV